MKLFIRAKCLILIFLVLAVSAGGAKAQQTVTGIVTDASTSETLPGVNILVKGTTKGTSTDVDGLYELEATSSDTLVVSFVGYQTQKIAVGSRSEINIDLQPQALVGEAVVVVGYGKEKQENLTGSVSSISTEEMSKVPANTVTDALQGMATGLQVLDGGGSPGRENLDILVRGQGTLGREGDIGAAGASRPLVLIDGVEGDLSNINMMQVEDISVLKDAASSAIYGSRAANGVILVTTKRGSSDGLQVSYNGYVGIQSRTAWPKRVDTETHMNLANLARENLLNWCLDGRTDQTTEQCRSNPNYKPRYTEEVIKKTLKEISQINILIMSG